MFVARFFFFHLFESPKLLLSRGRQAEAVAVVHGIAYKNRRQTWLSEEILNEIGGYTEDVGDQHLSNKEILGRQLEKFSAQRIKPLLAGKKLAINTVLVWYCELPIPDLCRLTKTQRLGEHRYGLPPLQRLPPSIPSKRRQRSTPNTDIHCLQELRNHFRRGCSRLDPRMLHGRYQVYWAYRDDGYLDPANRDLPLHFYRIVRA
jgi:hypothetical protein